MPTDAQLIWELFCVYMDSMLSPSPFMVDNSKKPFTNVYFHKKSTRFNPVQCGSNAFFIVQVCYRTGLYSEHSIIGPPLGDPLTGFLGEGRLVIQESAF